MGGHADPSSLFENLFGMGGRGGSRGPRKTDDVGYRLAVSLEDLYNGKTSKLALRRDKLCSACKGSGSKSGTKPAKCSTCGGHGQVIQTRQVGPGFMSRVQ